MESLYSNTRGIPPQQEELVKYQAGQRLALKYFLGVLLFANVAVLIYR